MRHRKRSRSSSRRRRDPDQSLQRIQWLTKAVEDGDEDARQILHDALLDAHDVLLRPRSPMMVSLADVYAHYIERAEYEARFTELQHIITFNHAQLDSLSFTILPTTRNRWRGIVRVYTTRNGFPLDP